jgi:glycolate oxidase
MELTSSSFHGAGARPGAGTSLRCVSPEDAVLAACAAALADGDVVTDPDRLPTYQRDRSTGTPAGEPIAVVFPRTTEQVSAVMKAAHEHRVPVVPRGAGSGLTGGSNALDGSLIVCVEKMRDVLLVDEVNGYVETQPGIFNTELRDYVAKHGMWYAPDPASKDYCSIGGNVNTNAGGLCCVKYGVTRDAVLGLEVVLADGRISRLGRRTIKGVSGYDLTGMMVGSEGTLGIVTMARLRLRPIPAPAATAVAVFSDIAHAGQAAADIMVSMTPSMLEVMDRASITAVENWRPMGLDTSAEALLLAQIDTPGDSGRAEVANLLDLCSRAGAVEVYQSDDPAEAEMLLGARRMIIPALEAQGDWLLDDVAVPRSELARAMREFQVIAERNDVLIATFGHAGDGNLHPTIVTPRGDADAAARAMRAFDEILDVGLACGGTVTGEHGVGSLKQHALFQELDEPARDLHTRIKDAWDPLGILNPGKSLPRW